jgi:phosphoglycerate-specific signal transduction histidine kinase
MKEVTIEIVVEKSDWLDADSIAREIEEKLRELQWRLATGGSKIVSVKVKNTAKLEQPTPVCCCPSVACPVHGLSPGSACGGW